MSKKFLSVTVGVWQQGADTLGSRLRLNLDLGRGWLLCSQQMAERGWPSQLGCWPGFQQTHLPGQLDPGPELKFVTFDELTPHHSRPYMSLKCVYCQSGLMWGLKSLYHYCYLRMKLWCAAFSAFTFNWFLCLYITRIVLHFPAKPYSFNLVRALSELTEGERKNVRREEEEEAMSVTQAYSGRALESSRVPVNASSFG